MKRENLLTIGQLSKLTNVKIKALQYYSKINILPPTYINPENGYRYYSYGHIHLVEAIKFCVEMNIPLVQIKDFISDDGSKINFKEFVDLGTSRITEKIKDYENILDGLKDINRQIARSEQMTCEEKVQEMVVRQQDYWMVPFKDTIATTKYRLALAEAYKEIHREGLIYDDKEEGIILLKYPSNAIETFVFIPLKEDNKNRLSESVKSLPSIRFVNKSINAHSIFEAADYLSENTHREYPQIIIQVEVFTKIFDFNSPSYEFWFSE